jgi:hypothetical protein
MAKRNIWMDDPSHTGEGILKMTTQQDDRMKPTT